MQARAQSWKGLYHLLQAFRERFEQREQREQQVSRGGGRGGGGGRNKAALLLPNWFEDAAEYRLKKALVR